MYQRVESGLRLSSLGILAESPRTTKKVALPVTLYVTPSSVSIVRLTLVVTSLCHFGFLPGRLSSSG